MTTRRPTLKHAYGIPGKGNGGAHAAYHGTPPPGFRAVCYKPITKGSAVGLHCTKAPGHRGDHGPAAWAGWQHRPRR